MERPARKTILLIEEDNDLRPMLRRSLDIAGFEVLLTVDEESALEWIQAGSFQFDLILINLVHKLPDEVLQIGRRLREQADREENTPVVVMAEAFSEDLAGTHKQAGKNDWIVYMEDRELQSLLNQLLQAAA